MNFLGQDLEWPLLPGGCYSEVVISSGLTGQWNIVDHNYHLWEQKKVVDYRSRLTTEFSWVGVRVVFVARWSLFGGNCWLRFVWIYKTYSKFICRVCQPFSDKSINETNWSRKAWNWNHFALRFLYENVNMRQINYSFFFFSEKFNFMLKYRRLWLFTIIANLQINPAKTVLFHLIFRFAMFSSFEV